MPTAGIERTRARPGPRRALAPATSLPGQGSWESGLRHTLAAIEGCGGGAPTAEGLLAPPTLEALNQVAAQSGLRAGAQRQLRFVDAAPLGRLSAVEYESHNGRTGDVPTRCRGPGAWHDWYNALIWLNWPRTKRALNDAQCRQIASSSGLSADHGQRDRRRDAITLFDESGLVMVCAMPLLRHALREQRWRPLFIEQRYAFVRHARLRPVGHGLLDKLRTPFKGVCARVWILPVDAQTPAATIDALLAEAIARGAPWREALPPMPVLGVPGWWPANESADFYDDPTVFRQRSPR
ncbi:MAG: DUF3025 domain-containing protein [Burkholderiaceae bacterium]